MESGRIKTDCLVIGTGIAGATCALIAAKAGLDVILITKRSEAILTNTNKAQGGIIYKGKNDTPELLIKDIIRAGRNFNFIEAVNFLAHKGPEIVKEVLIDDLKIDFTHIAGSDIDDFNLTKEGGHSLERILYYKDQTGKIIEETLIDHLNKYPNIKIETNATAIDLITLHHNSKDIQCRYSLEDRCLGVYVLNNNTKEVRTMLSKCTVLATGGLGDVYLHSTNEKGTVGDGIVMAKRAGARVINMEFVQFHPTTLYIPGGKRFLISEAVRGEGARLKNLQGEYFMERYNKKMKDLAPRDEVTIAIWEEMIKNKDEYVLLDAANFIKDDIQERFPNIYQECKKNGIDITKDAIPVVPAAHYFCGGVSVNLAGRTTINGLYAVGEVSCTGLHGANRLASTSLLEGLVWGYFSAKDIIKRVNSDEKITNKIFNTIRDWVPSGKLENEDPALIAQDWMSIKNTMWNYVGIVRTIPRLKRAIEDLRHMYIRIEDFYKETAISKDIVSLFHGVQSAIMVAEAAYRNRDAIGCHNLKT